MHADGLTPRSRPEWARESVCCAQGGHARRRPVRIFSCAPSERDLGRGGALSPKPRACSFLAAAWAESCGPLGRQTDQLRSRSTPLSPRGGGLENLPVGGGTSPNSANSAGGSTRAEPAAGETSATSAALQFHEPSAGGETSATSTISAAPLFHAPSAVGEASTTSTISTPPQLHERVA